MMVEEHSQQQRSRTERARDTVRYPEVERWEKTLSA
jgi:hypothetical protein